MKTTSNKVAVALIVILLIIAAFMAYFKKLPLKEETTSGPNGYTQTNTNPTGADYQPNANLE